MSFQMRTLFLENFRNYPHIDVSLDRNITLIIGENAVGKTNIIEAIQLLTTGESFRNPTPEEMILWSEKVSSISYYALEDRRELEVRAIIDDKKTFSINGKRKRVADLRGVFPSVLFTPDDLRIIKDSSVKRRDALDNVGIQLSKTYSTLKSEYERIVRQRNSLLKDDEVSKVVMDSWNESLIGVGALFYKHRRNLFEKMRERFLDICSTVFPAHEIDVRYLPSWERYLECVGSDEAAPEDNIKVALSAIELREQERGITLIGPHKDDIVFTIDGKDARTYGSQGQQRLLILAWKLSEVKVIEEIDEQIPILLLDDVMSELDKEKRELLIGYIAQDVQTVITSTNIDYFPAKTVESSTVIHI